jgi:hypothetical protein
MLSRIPQLLAWKFRSMSCTIRTSSIYLLNMHFPWLNDGSKLTMYFPVLKRTNSAVLLLQCARLSETHNFNGMMKQVDCKYGILEWDSFVKLGSTNLLSFISPRIYVGVWRARMQLPTGFSIASIIILTFFHKQLLEWTECKPFVRTAWRDLLQYIRTTVSLQYRQRTNTYVSEHMCPQFDFCSCSIPTYILVHRGHYDMRIFLRNNDSGEIQSMPLHPICLRYANLCITGERLEREKCLIS